MSTVPAATPFAMRGRGLPVCGWTGLTLTSAHVNTAGTRGTALTTANSIPNADAGAVVAYVDAKQAAPPRGSRC